MCFKRYSEILFIIFLCAHANVTAAITCILTKLLLVDTATSWLTQWWLCLLTEWNQLSVVRWQWHGVHTLGPSRWRGGHCDGRVCVHGCERRLAESWLWNHAAGSPLSCPATKSVLLQCNFKKIWAFAAQRCISSAVSVTHEEWKHTPFSAFFLLSQAVNHLSHMRWCVPPHGWNLNMGVTTLNLWRRNLHLKSRESTAGKKVWSFSFTICELSVLLSCRRQWYHGLKFENLIKS